MSKRKINGLPIEEVSQIVACSLLRVVKTYDHYNTFRKAFRNFNPSSRDPFEGLLDDGSRREPVIHDKTKFGRFIGRITDAAIKDMDHCPRRGDKYEDITLLINAFLRLTLEKNGVPMQQLGLLGQEIFDMTCYKLYGEEYLNEMDSLNAGAPRATNEVEALLISEFMARIQNGEQLSWEDFYHKNYERVRRHIESHQQRSSWNPYETWEIDDDDDEWEWEEED